MMHSAQRHREFVAHAAADCGALGKPEMMRVRGASAAEQAWLQRYELEVIAVAVAPRFAQREVGLVDAWSKRVLRAGFIPIGQCERQGSVECEPAGLQF